MKFGTKVLAPALLALISTWGLSGCSKPEPVTTPQVDTRNKESEKGDEHANHAEAKKGGAKDEEHAKHGDHKRGEHKDQKHGDTPKSGHVRGGSHKKGEHTDHKHGERRDEPAPKGGVKVGDAVPDFSVRTLDGKSVKLSELRKDDKLTKEGVVVLSFWCATCHSCRDVEHLLAKLAKDYAGKAAVVALDANADDTAEAVAAFVKKNKLDLPVFLDPAGHTADLFGVKRTTTTVVIDGDGALRYCGQFRHKAGGSAEEALKAVLAGKEVAVKTTPHNG